MTSKHMRDVLEDAISGSEPPPRGGADEVFAKAGRMAARQRLTVGASAIGVVAVLALVAANVGFGQRPNDVQTMQPGGAPTLVSASAAPKTKSVVDVLIGLLPEGLVVTESSGVDGWAQVTVKDRLGETTLMVNVQAEFPIDDVFACETRGMAKGTTCVDEKLDGEVLVIRTDGPYGAPQLDVRVAQRAVDYRNAERLRVSVVVWNASDPKRGAITRPTPALTLEQIAKIAMSPQWSEVKALAWPTSVGAKQ